VKALLANDSPTGASVGKLTGTTIVGIGDEWQTTGVRQRVRACRPISIRCGRGTPIRS
jgi:hypothetical protein